LPFNAKSILIHVDTVTAISLAGGYQGYAQYFRNPRLTPAQRGPEMGLAGL